jgi:error-prone DNA polymerase
MTAYAELQVTTNFSFLRGGSHAEELVAQAKHLGLSAIAVTDRNTLAGVVRAHIAGKDMGLKIIIGARLDLVEGISLLCYSPNRSAYGRLCTLLTMGQRRAEKGRCTLTLEDVALHQQGLIFIIVPPAGMPDDSFESQLKTGTRRPPSSCRHHALDGPRPRSSQSSCSPCPRSWHAARCHQ